jgi:DNA-binding response OmpR family regulator
MSPARPSAPATGHFITLVESDPVERDRMTKTLQAEGYTVRAVPTLDAAMSQGLWDGSPKKLLITHPLTQTN